MQVFLNWFEQLALHGYRPNQDFERVEREFKNIEEVKSMLMTAIEKDREGLLKTGEEIGEARGVQIGEARGVQIGEARGKLLAQRQTLLQLLRWRFQPSAEEGEQYALLLEKISDLDHLTQLIDQLLTSSMPEEFEQKLLTYLPKDEEQK